MSSSRREFYLFQQLLHIRIWSLVMTAAVALILQGPDHGEPPKSPELLDSRTRDFYAPD